MLYYLFTYKRENIYRYGVSTTWFIYPHESLSDVKLIGIKYVPKLLDNPIEFFLYYLKDV